MGIYAGMRLPDHFTDFASCFYINIRVSAVRDSNSFPFESITSGHLGTSINSRARYHVYLLMFFLSMSVFAYRISIRYWTERTELTSRLSYTIRLKNMHKGLNYIKASQSPVDTKRRFPDLSFHYDVIAVKCRNMGDSGNQPYVAYVFSFQDGSIVFII